MGGSVQKRAQWDKQIEFILACVGYCVGLGNVWRFPYLCYKNGGGAFLIPYTIALLVAGLPLFYMELCLGQFSSLGPVKIFAKTVPIFQGVGWAMVICSFLVMIYYNMILAWVLFYFFHSFRSNLIWSTCRNWFNTMFCHSNLETRACQAEFGEDYGFFNKTCMNATELLAVNQTYHGILDAKKTSPGEEFFEKFMLNMSDSFGDFGNLQWKLVVALGVAWLIVFLCLIKGVKSTGKVVYFTATFPYVVLIILFFRGVTLDGAGEGIQFYITPNMSRLGDVSVWKDAAIQIFYSLGPAFGGLHTMASYNKFTNNCFRDALFVAITNCFTSVFAGFAVFSIAGFMAKDLGLPVSNVVRDGTGLAFIAYPEAISRMPLSPLWAVLFFFMLVTLGLDSMFATCETVTTAIQDQFSKLRKHTSWVVLVTCLVSFVLGLPLCTRAGIYVFTLLNDYSAGYPVMLLAFFEVTTTVWIYGVNRFVKDIQMMIGVSDDFVSRFIGPTGQYWRFTWMFLAPVFLMTIAVMSLVFYSVSSYGDYKFTLGPELMGWFVSIISIVWVPIFAVYRIMKNRLDGKPFMDLFRPAIDWCPGEERDRRKLEAVTTELLPCHPV